MKKILDLATQHESNSARQAENFRTQLEIELERAERALKNFSQQSKNTIKGAIIELQQERKKRRKQTLNAIRILVVLLLLSLSINLALAAMLATERKEQALAAALTPHIEKVEWVQGATVITLTQSDQVKTRRNQEESLQIRVAHQAQKGAK